MLSDTAKADENGSVLGTEEELAAVPIGRGEPGVNGGRHEGRRRPRRGLPRHGPVWGGVKLGTCRQGRHGYEGGQEGPCQGHRVSRRLTGEPAGCLATRTLATAGVGDAPRARRAGRSVRTRGAPGRRVFADFAARVGHHRKDRIRDTARESRDPDMGRLFKPRDGGLRVPPGPDNEACGRSAKARRFVMTPDSLWHAR